MAEKNRHGSASGEEKGVAKEKKARLDQVEAPRLALRRYIVKKREFALRENTKQRLRATR